MSLEQQLAELRASIVELTAISKSLYDLRADAIETIKTQAAPAAAKKADAKKAEPKAEEPAAPAAEQPKTEEPVAISPAADDSVYEQPKTEEPVAISPAADDSVYEEAKTLVGQYTSGSDRPEEVQARKERVKKLLRHEKLVKPDLADPSKFSVSDVKADMVPVLVKNLKLAIEQGDITEPAKADADDLL